ncbi:MAG: hypothetical protein K9J21_07360 [Bacteroidales bacterium]|nr:hypothetical protein [Bacteroidales bacterium]
MQHHRQIEREWERTRIIVGALTGKKASNLIHLDLDNLSKPEVDLPQEEIDRTIKAWGLKN